MRKIVGENEGQINLGHCYLNLETPIEIVFSQNIMCFTDVPNFLQFCCYSEVLDFCLLAKLQQDVVCSSKSRRIQSLLPLVKLYTKYP